MPLIEGEALQMPHFCYNRLTDMVCFVWILPQAILPVDPMEPASSAAGENEDYMSLPFEGKL